MLRTVIKWSVAVIGFLLVMGLASLILVGWSLARPVQRHIGDPPSDLNAQTVHFMSGSGATVMGWFCPVANERGVVLLLPGIRANRLSMVGRARFLQSAGYSVVLIDFQATGETHGDRITFGWKESRDVIAAVDHIRSLRPVAPIGIIGSSLGGAAALLATPPLKVDALALESVYPTIKIATANRLERYLGPLGRAVTPFLLKQLRPRLGVSATKLRPIDHVGDVRCPILIMAGEKDRYTRPEDTRWLFARAHPPKELWFVPNAGHVDLHRAATQEYESRLLAFLKQM